VPVGIILRRISAASAEALRARRIPVDVRVAADYPTEFSFGVGQHAGSDGALGSFFLHRSEDDVVVGEIGGGFVAAGVVEIGYAVVASCWGRGYATEAVRALMDRAAAVPGLGRIVAHAPLDRPASGRVLEKAGFVLVGEEQDEHEGVPIRVNRWEHVVPQGAGVEIRRELMTTPSAASLIQALNAELSALYPEAGANHFRLDASEVAAGRGAFLVAYLGDNPVGCGAIRLLGDNRSAEVKRMYVVAAHRARGIGRSLLAALRAEASLLGAKRLVLETGERQRDALALYGKLGFERIPPFGEYLGSPLSVCMAKDL
jgi:putative acetyltransferase